MNYIHIHYDPARDGEIISWLSGSLRHDYSVSDRSHLPGLLVTTIEIADGHNIVVNPKKQRVDIATLELVDKQPDEIAHAMLPTEFEVKAAILRELELTDAFANPPPDMPRKGVFLLDWKPYRQALRDLSKLPSHLDAMKQWPQRPDAIEIGNQ